MLNKLYLLRISSIVLIEMYLIKFNFYVRNEIESKVN